jgi:glycosyltransferase involved in cell wall biosynthesis
MKIALAHDFLIKWGGAEKVLFDLHKIFPEAPIYTLFYDKDFAKEYFPRATIKSSYLQKRYRLLKGIRGRQGINGIHKLLLPFMPLATESMDFSDYDLVVSSSSAFLKGIIVPVKTKHICYMHTPTRWAWQDRPLAASTRKILMAISGISLMNLVKRIYIHLYRLWDFEAAQRPDILIANSKYTARRIGKYYKRRAEVIYPGVEVENIKPQIPHKKYFVVVSRLSAYKKIDLIIEAFKDLPFNLLIVGDGSEAKSLKFKVESLKLKNRIFFTGFVGDKKVIAKLIKNSTALIHLTEEDFGICMAEALSLGKPVIGLEKGGAKEIIKRGYNGELIDGKNNKEIINNLKNAVKKLALNEKKYIINIGKEDDGIFSGEKFTTINT